MMSSRLPLLPSHSGKDVVAWSGDRAITAARFLDDVEYLAKRLPAKRYVLNLCKDRYFFLVGFSAALVAGHVSLMPPNRTPTVLRQLKARFNDLYCLTDGDECTNDMAAIRVGRAPEGVAAAASFHIPRDAVAAMVFTSGTTGRPRPYEKTWSSLVHVARSIAASFGIDENCRLTALATVPPQHMFGLEASIMLPLQNGGVVHAAHPFFPEDVRTAMESCPTPHFLVTTPFHLRTCLEAGLRFPVPQFVLSATAALNRSLAAMAEAEIGAPVFEIYGCTETGAIGTRRTVESDAWELIAGISATVEGNEATITGRHLTDSVPLADYVELLEDGRLRLIGRKADLVNVAGKRTSLSDLNQKLLEIEGVKDGCFFVPDTPDQSVSRLVALVVAPALSRQQLMAELRERVDPVFLPRPLYLVDRLPRSATGKVTRAELQAMAARHKRVSLRSAG